MKTKILLFAIVCMPIFVWGQKNSTERDTLPKVEVTPPEFTGITSVNKLFNNSSMKDIGKYLFENFQYSEEACYIEGTVIVQFVITANGELNNFNVINSVCPVIDNEFIRVLETTSGMWKPGLNNMKPVDMEKEVSMMFVAKQQYKSNPKSYFTNQARNYFTKANNLFLEKHNLKKALRNYDQTIKYLPYDASSLLVRGLCKYELGDMDGARADWKRVNEIGRYDATEYINKLVDFQGYAEMTHILNN